VGILAALRERDRTGLGSRVTSALYESCAFMVAQHMAGEIVTGEPPPPMPIRRGAWGIYEVFRTKEGENLFIGITSDPHWERFCAHFKRPDWFADPRFTTNGDRVMNKEALRPLVAEVAAAHTVAELAAALEEASIPFSEVRKPHDLFEDAQMNANGRMLETRMLQGQTAKLPTLPLDINGESPTLRHQPPQAGEHTDEILLGLGYDRNRIAALRTDQRVS
jgi:crotonobetainyl-CoA:carnitine CoA-transferase CaiB-like acyl-CoA transferase